MTSRAVSVIGSRISCVFFPINHTLNQYKKLVSGIDLDCRSLPCHDGLNLWFRSSGHRFEMWHQQRYWLGLGCKSNNSIPPHMLPKFMLPQPHRSFCRHDLHFRNCFWLQLVHSSHYAPQTQAQISLRLWNVNLVTMVHPKSQVSSLFRAHSLY